MIDLCFFYSAKMAVVFILMLSSATLEAKQNDKFYDLMTAIGEHFGGEFNDAEKVLELDLNGANSFLDELHTFATREIVTKNENGEFECKNFKKPDFKLAIKTILGEKSDKDVRNLLKAIIVQKPIKTVLDEQSFKKMEDLVKGLSEFSEEQLFNLLFSLAARLEALVHGKNCDGTLKEKQENPKDLIQTFLAVPKCFILPESELSIFDYWIEIIETKTKESQNPIFGVAIYKDDKYKSEYRKGEAFKLSRKNYQILKQLNDQKFSIYESSNLLRAIGYMPTEKIPQIFWNLLFQIHSVLSLHLKIYDHYLRNKKCTYAMVFQNILESLMKMMSNKGIDPELHFNSQDKEIQEYVQNDVEENCKKFDNEEAKILFLNNVRYDLAINFEFNQRKDVYERVEHLLIVWVYYAKFSKESYLKENFNLSHFTSEETNREKISIIEALIGKDHFQPFNLVSLFDQIKTLVEVAIPKEEANLEKAKKEINTEQLGKDIEFLEKNPKNIAEEKYQKAFAIICTIKQHGEKVEMLKSKIKNIEIQEQLIELSSKIQNNEIKYFGHELWEQTKEFCKIGQIEMEEIVSEEIILKDLQFEFNEIWESSKGVWRGIEEYYLSIPLLKLTGQAQTLAITFGRMLENVKEYYAQKMNESNVGGDMIISE